MRETEERIMGDQSTVQIEMIAKEFEAAFGRPHCWTDDGGYSSPLEWLTTLIEAVAPDIDGEMKWPAAAAFAFVDTIIPEEDVSQYLMDSGMCIVLETFARRLGELTYADRVSVQTLFKALRDEMRSERGLRGRDTMMVVRAALTGRRAGPCLEIVVCLLGRRRSLARVQNCLKLLRGDLL